MGIFTISLLVRLGSQAYFPVLAAIGGHYSGGLRWHSPHWQSCWPLSLVRCFTCCTGRRLYSRLRRPTLRRVTYSGCWHAIRHTSYVWWV